MKKNKKILRIANVFIVILAAFFMLRSVYAYISFGLPFNVAELVIDYILPIFFSLFIAAGLFLKKEGKLNILLFSMSITIMLYVVELSLYFLKIGPKTREEIVAINGGSWDSRSKIEVIKQYEKENIISYPRVSPSVWLSYDSVTYGGEQKIVPLGGVSNALTILCNEAGQWLDYKSDQYGFRNPTNMFASGKIDAVAVGDSFLQGVCVHQGQNISDEMIKAGVRVVNLGNAGNGPLAELAGIREYAAPIKPKYVLWFYYSGNDLKDLATEKESSLVRYLEKNFKLDLINKQELIDKMIVNLVNKEYMRYLSSTNVKSDRYKEPDNIIVYLAKMKKIRRFAVQFIKSFQIKDEKEVGQEVVELFFQVLDAANGDIKKVGARLVFVYLPTYSNLADRQPNEYNNKAKIEKYVKNMGGVFVDIDKLFRKDGDPLQYYPYRLPGHYTPSGYKLIADNVVKFIKR